MRFFCLLVGVCVTLVCVRCSADTTSANKLPEFEVAEINKFLRDFTNALNSNDADRIKRMSGGAWAHFSSKLECKEIVEGFEIISVLTDKVTNVVTRATVVDKKGRPYNVDVVFDLNKVEGGYSIDKMRLPESERLHEEFEAANQNFKNLIVAIKAKDIDKVKKALPFGDVADFDAELSARGLSWITDAVNSDVVISGGWGVRRSGKEGFVGHVEIPSMPGGTNVLHEVIFKGLRIDRAAPRRETKEEFLKRFRVEQESIRKQYKEDRLSRQRR